VRRVSGFEELEPFSNNALLLHPDTSPTNYMNDMPKR